jgi:hypothetical protein
MIAKKLNLLVMALGFSLAFGFAGKAEADVKQACVLNALQVDNDTGLPIHRMFLVCNDGATKYYVFTNVPGCVNSDVDTIKMWLSMLEAALLSGRQVDFLYNPPVIGGTCGIAVMTSLTAK